MRGRARRISHRLSRARPTRALIGALQGWSDDRCGSMAAALAFYAAFSMAPMLVIIVAVAGYFVGAEAVEGRLIGEIRNLIGEDSATVVQAMIANAWKSGKGWTAWISAGAVVLGASATFAQLTQSLNVIWHQSPSDPPLWALIHVRLRSFGVVVGIAFLIVVLLVFDAAVTFFLENVLGLQAGMRRWAMYGQRLIVLLTLIAAFAVLLKVLPAPKLRWRTVIVGAVASALLFSIGKNLFGLYLSRAGTANAFGAAGSLAVLLMWLYFSSAVFLFGAEITANWRRTFEPAPVAAIDDDPARPLD